MFSPVNRTKSTLLCGPLEFTKSFVFEAAIYWAEEGHRVVYITPAPLESLPCTFHDRKHLSPVAFKLMRFMYLANYETLIEQLVDLQTFEILPSVILIDNLDKYIQDPVVTVQPELHIARLCAFIQDSTNAISRILNSPVHLCVSVSTEKIAKTPYSLYFNDVWHLRVLNNDGNGQILELIRDQEDGGENATRTIFNYGNFTDGTLVLKQISEKFISHS